MLPALILSLFNLYFASSCAASSSSSHPITTTTTSASTTTSLKASSTTSTSTSTTTTTTAGSCPTGWTMFQANCYYLSADTGTEPDAEEACKQRGGNLVSIHSAAENAFVQMLTGGVPVWIGVIRTAPGVVAWENVDGTPFDYHNWVEGAVGDNAGGVEDCTIMNLTGNNGLWETDTCVAAGQFRYVCEMPA